MQGDTTRPVESRRNYKGVVDALTRIVREGASCKPEFARASLLAGVVSSCPHPSAREHGTEQRSALTTVCDCACRGFHYTVPRISSDPAPRNRDERWPDDHVRHSELSRLIDCSRMSVRMIWIGQRNL